MGTTSSIAMQSMGEIELRTLAVGAKIWCFSFVTFGVAAHGGHSLDKHCVMIYRLIVMLFSTFFHK